MSWLGSFGFMTAAFFFGLALAVGGLLTVRKFVSHDTLASHHDVATPFMSAVGTLYAVVLGFIVVDSLNTFERARVTLEHEASAIHELFHISEGLPAADALNIRQNALGYCEAVVKYEWPSMQQGRMSENARHFMSKLWGSVAELKTNTPSENTIHGALIEQMTRLEDCRDSRRVEASPNGDPLVWGVLLVGAVITVVFTYFFGLENIRAQILMTILVTTVLNLNLILVASFGYPYSGDVNVSPEPFQFDVEHFKSMLAGNEK
jgi:hypothetical protein